MYRTTRDRWNRVQRRFDWEALVILLLCSAIGTTLLFAVLIGEATYKITDRLPL